MKPNIQHLVGRRICKLRHEHRISQEELAAMLNNFHSPITRDVVANWEIGRTEVPAYCIQLIAYSLGVKVVDIVPDLTFKGLIAERFMSNPASKRK